MQAYFVKPDVINVFTTTMDYSVRIKSEDNKLYKLKHNIPLTRKYPKRVTYCDCIYWNGKGNYDYIRSLFLHKQVYDISLKRYTKAEDFSEPIGKEPPVPTEKDWEGWHKLEKNTK